MNRWIMFNKVNRHFLLLTLALIFSCKPTSQVSIAPLPGSESSQPEVEAQVAASDASAVKSYTETIAGTDVSFEMAPIPEGTFLMGSPEDEVDRDDDEGPQKEVSMDAFWMMTTETTWDLFELFIDKDKSAKVDYGSEDLKVIADAITRPSTPYLDPSFGMGRYGFPAISMTQYSALTFCKWLSKVTGKFYRLPTEAEWEYACRAGSTTAYYFGDDVGQLGDYAWYWDNCEDKYHKVGLKKANAWGLYDMHGNVAEWTMDHYQADYYATIQQGAKNPWRMPTALYPRTVRGGAWDDDAAALRSANRIESKREWQKRDPQIPKSFWWNTDAPFLGFRVVRPSKEMTKEEIEEFFSIALDE